MGQTQTILEFVFIKACIKQTKHAKCKSNCAKNKNHNFTFNLKKEDFVLSTLAISTSKEDAWNEFLINIHKYISSQFVISLRKCKSMHSFAACLLKIFIDNDKNYVKLYFKCNVVPSFFESCPKNCIPISTPVPVINNQSNTGHVFLPISDFKYKLHDKYYYDLKFYCDGNYENTFCFTQKPPLILL